MSTHCTITVLPEPFIVESASFDLKVETTFSKNWLEAFKRKTFRDDRFWSGGAGAWFVKSGFQGGNLTTLCNLGLQYFDHVELIEGDCRANLKTRELSQQGSLFAL
jgi:hypothetical protein